MAITFPNSPSQGDTYTAENGLSYEYDGTKWTTVSATTPAAYWDRTGTTLSPAATGDVVQVSAGTAALPGLTPVGDTDTGLYAPAANELAVSTAGSESFRVDASGYLLVGATTASGTANLQVTGGATIGGTTVLNDGPTINGGATLNGATSFGAGVSGTEQTITAGSFDLDNGNFWTVGAVAIPNPTNAVAGISGLIRITAAPTSWGSNFKFPGGTAPSLASFPAMIAFYVQDSTNILMGTAAEGIA
ncbi:hypothetical protein [Synechococcus phage S-B68]|nr:hypothetical protein [Synechococcus phage S-B68]